MKPYLLVVLTISCAIILYGVVAPFLFSAESDIAVIGGLVLLIFGNCAIFAIGRAAFSSAKNLFAKPNKLEDSEK